MCFFFFPIVLLQKNEPVDFSVNPQADRTFQFFDHRLMESVKLGDSKVYEFLRLLALCHTVMSEENSAGKYKAVVSLAFEIRNDTLFKIFGIRRMF